MPVFLADRVRVRHNFLHAGVVGIVNGCELYLHGIVGALMIHSKEWPSRKCIGHIDLNTDASVVSAEGPAKQAV